MLTPAQAPPSPSRKRTLWRIIGMIAVLSLGGVVISLGIILPGWLSTALASIGAGIQPIGASLAVIIPGIALFGTGGVWLAHSSWRNEQQAITPAVMPLTVSVHLDLENQNSRFAPEQGEAFIRQLRQHIASEHAQDASPRPLQCSFYCYYDAISPGHLQIARYLWRYGFHLIDVPHRIAATTRRQSQVSFNLIEAVDITLTAHIAEQVFAAASPQHIIIISADRGYWSLIHRLRERDHQVSLWANSFSPEMHQLAQDLGVTLWEYGQSTGQTLPPILPAPAITRSPLSMVETTRTPLLLSGLYASFLAAFEASLHIWEEQAKQAMTLAAPVRYQNLLSELQATPELQALGYSGFIREWMILLRCLGIFLQPSSKPFPDRGPTAPKTAARAMQSFYRHLDRAIAQFVPTSDPTVVGLAQLKTTMIELRRETPRIAHLGSLMSLLEGKRNMLALCQVLVQSGMLRSVELFDGKQLRISRAAPAPA